MGRAFILELIRGVLRDRADKREDEQAQSQANAVSAAIAAHEAAKPTDGALVRMVFLRQALPDAPGPGEQRFAYLEHGFGASESEARVALNQQQVQAPIPGANERVETREKWIPPVAPVAPSALLTAVFRAWPPAGIRGTKLKFQNVKWDSAGFDDEAVTEVRVPAGRARRTPASRSCGCPRSCRDKAVPVEPRAPREGPSVPSVDLDPGTPFADVHAVAVFPENEATRMAFERVPATVVGAWLPLLPNFELLRWVRPEDLRVLPAPRLPPPPRRSCSCRSMPSLPPRVPGTVLRVLRHAGLPWHPGAIRWRDAVGLGPGR